MYVTVNYELAGLQAALLHTKGQGNLATEVTALSALAAAQCGHIYNLCEAVNKHAQALRLHHCGLRNSHRRGKTLEEKMENKPWGTD